MDWDCWIGFPWEDRGRGPRAYDCWGLTRAAFEAGTGIWLPNHAVGTDEDREEIGRIVKREAAQWIGVRTGTERAFDVAVLRLNGTWHMGLVVERGRMLHVRRGRSSAIEPLTRFGTLELYRHVALGAARESHRNRQRA